MEKHTNDMTPMDGGAAVLIPQGNMRDDIPGTYGWMQKKYWANKKEGWWSEIE